MSGNCAANHLSCCSTILYSLRAASVLHVAKETEEAGRGWGGGGGGRRGGGGEVVCAEMRDRGARCGECEFGERGRNGGRLDCSEHRPK